MITPICSTHVSLHQLKPEYERIFYLLYLLTMTTHALLLCIVKCTHFNVHIQGFTPWEYISSKANFYFAYEGVKVQTWWLCPTEVATGNIPSMALRLCAWAFLAPTYFSYRNFVKYWVHVIIHNVQPHVCLAGLRILVETFQTQILSRNVSGIE